MTHRGWVAALCSGFVRNSETGDASVKHRNESATTNIKHIHGYYKVHNVGGGWAGRCALLYISSRFAVNLSFSLSLTCVLCLLSFFYSSGSLTVYIVITIPQFRSEASSAR